MRVWLFAIVPLFLCAFLVGCGTTAPTGPSYGSDDGRKIAVLVGDLNDVKSLPDRYKKLFATGVALSATERKKLDTIHYEVQGEPTVNGDAATATIAMRSESASSADLGTKEWAFVKEGDQWKIKSAPLR